MNTRRINGYLFEQMLYNGLANLRQMEQTLNSLNVFPVADGDTGTNMRLTLENGLRYAQRGEPLHAYLRTFNDGLLLGARGNSGVILSQIFRGIYLYLSRCNAANCGDLRNALIHGYKTAYQAVVQPVEGTILTVAREGIEHIRSHIDRNTTIETLLSMYIAEMKKSLAQTPEILSVLKASGVVDSGAFGYITLVEGMYKYLNGELIRLDAPIQQFSAQERPALSPLEAFNENSSFDEGYCMEFILQLLRSPAYTQQFDLPEFINALRPFGNSIAATRDRSRVKVHIHTKTPAFIITLCQRYGEFSSFKLENMQLQHNEQEIAKQQKGAEPSDITHASLPSPPTVPTSQATPPKALGIIAVADGDGVTDEFLKLGCDRILPGGATMNPPSSDFLTAFEEMNAEHILVLPNSKNVIGAAEQAAGLSRHSHIRILPTKTVAEGYFAVAMDVGNSQNVEARLESMTRGAEGVVTLSVARAGKHFTDGHITCDEGDFIAVLNDATRHDTVVCSAQTPEEAMIGGMAQIEDIDDRETCLIFCGDASNETMEDALSNRLSDTYAHLEADFVHGGQHTYIWICGII